MTQSSKINSSSVVVVSGGGKGVTAQCVIKLAQSQCKFILLGRSPLAATEPVWAQGCFDESGLKRQIMQVLIAQGEKPTPGAIQKQYQAIASQREITSTLQAIQQAGGQAEYVDVDITHYTDLQQKLAAAVQRLGAITGIIHGAGNLADKRIENKTERDFETVYAAKVEGLENLLRSVELNQLKFLVLFSSFVSFYGNPGQSDYALANEILNKSAHRLNQQYPSCQVVAIGWGPWDGGMVTPQLKKHFAQLDVALIPAEVGAQLLADELSDFYPETAQFNVMSRPLMASPRQIEPENRTYRIRRKLTLSANPFVCDHVIGSRPVLPAMCGISWLVNVSEQLYPGYQFLQCQDFRVLKGIVFDETLADSYVLDLKEQSTSESEEINLEALVWSESGKNIPHYHYRCQIRLVKVGAQTKSFQFSHALSASSLKLFPYQDGTLFHLDSFQSFQQVIDLTPQRMIVRCHLRSVEISRQGQFPAQAFNAYTADTFFQCLLVWVKKFYDLGSLPSQFETLRQFQMIPFNQDFYISLNVVSENTSKIVADATAYDSQGNIYIEIEKMQVTTSPRLSSLFLENAYSALANQSA
jgi:NAD(P)-dependent dehydrogenase (short-subunit alcohol dehydrogenase family)